MWILVAEQGTMVIVKLVIPAVVVGNASILYEQGFLKVSGVTVVSSIIATVVWGNLQSAKCADDAVCMRGSDNGTSAAYEGPHISAVESGQAAVAWGAALGLWRHSFFELQAR